MASSSRIDGSYPKPGSTVATVISGAWAVDYDWSPDQVVTVGQPQRLSSLKFPPGFDADLDGVVRGQGKFSQFLYLFKGGKYQRMIEATMTPDDTPKDIAGPWDLPPSWTSIDAVVSGGGKKSGFSYFFRADEYIRYDWSANSGNGGRSSNYPKFIGPNWHTPAPFTKEMDGLIVGGGPGFDRKAYLFKRETVNIGDDGNTVPTGGHSVQIPVYARYDFDDEKFEFEVKVPNDVITLWHGLMPLLDSGPAVDLAIRWVDAGLAAVVAKTAGTTTFDTAFAHHFMTNAPNAGQLATIASRLSDVRARLTTIPDKFRWEKITFPAQTVYQTLTEVGDDFCSLHGPNGRGAIMIHEAVHFVMSGGVDVPEWSGETINGVTYGPAVVGGVTQPTYHTISQADALTNPSSYAAFAQEAFAIVAGISPADTRYGMGRPQE